MSLKRLISKMQSLYLTNCPHQRSLYQIINQYTILNKLSERQIINHSVLDYAHAYDCGYRIVVKNTDCIYYYVNDARTINNAYNNGLYAQYAYFGSSRDNHNIMQCVFDDVRTIYHSNSATTILCNRAEKILELCGNIEPLLFAKNIKK